MAWRSSTTQTGDTAGRNEKAGLDEIGTLGALGTIPNHKFGGGGAPFYPTVETVYEPTQSWAIVSIEGDPWRVVVIDLDSGLVRNACDEMIGAYAPLQIIAEVPVFEQASTFGGYSRQHNAPSQSEGGNLRM